MSLVGCHNIQNHANSSQVMLMNLQFSCPSHQDIDYDYYKTVGKCKVNTMIDLLNTRSSLSAVVLSRQRRKLQPL